MDVGKVTYDTVSSFLLGYQLATDGGALTGFHEWLVVRIRRGDNLAWTALVLYAAFPDSANPLVELKKPGSDEVAVKVLGHLLNEFWSQTSSRDGLRQVFVDYNEWCKQREQQLESLAASIPRLDDDINL